MNLGPSALSVVLSSYSAGCHGSPGASSVKSPGLPWQATSTTLGLVPRLPWNHRLRMGFSVQAQGVSVPQRLAPQWGAASSFPPPHPENQTQASAPRVVPGPPPQQQRMALRVMLRYFLRKRLQCRLRWSPQIASQTFCLMQ